MPLLLTKEDVVRVLNMRDCIDVVGKAFAELASGTAVLPLRIGIAPPDGVSLYMPAYLKQMGALACKIVTVYKNNPTRHNLPTIIGKVLLQDPATGEVTCIMDGGYLTAVRTGAAELPWRNRAASPGGLRSRWPSACGQSPRWPA